MELTREEAWQLFTEFNKSDSLVKHGLAVEGVKMCIRDRGEALCRCDDSAGEAS